MAREDRLDVRGRQKKMEPGNEMQMRAGFRSYKKKGGSAALFCDINHLLAAGRASQCLTAAGAGASVTGGGGGTSSSDSASVLRSSAISNTPSIHFTG